MFDKRRREQKYGRRNCDCHISRKFVLLWLTSKSRILCLTCNTLHTYLRRGRRSASNSESFLMTGNDSCHSIEQKVSRSRIFQFLFDHFLTSFIIIIVVVVEVVLGLMLLLFFARSCCCSLRHPLELGMI